MAKPLSEKSRLIREAILENLHLENSAIAEELNNAPARHNDRLRFETTDVSAQRMALRKLGTLPDEADEKPREKSSQRFQPTRKPEPPPVRISRSEPEDEPEPMPNGRGLTTDDVRQLVDLAQKAGGVRKLVELLELIRTLGD